MRPDATTIGCSTLLGAVVAFLLAPMIQRRLAYNFPISSTKIGPALFIMAVGATIGTIAGWRAAKRRKW